MQPYRIQPLPVGTKPFYRCKYPHDTRFALEFDEATASIAEKVRFARITAGLEQEELAKMIEVDRTTLLRLENGQVTDEHTKTSTLIKIAVACGREATFCCDEYHSFMADGYGARIRKLRKENGWTQRIMSSRMGVALTTVKRWEQEKSRPSREHFEQLMKLVREGRM